MLENKRTKDDEFGIETCKLNKNGAVLWGNGGKLHTENSHTHTNGSLVTWLKRRPQIRARDQHTSFFDFSSSELKLLSNSAKNKFSTMKLPMTSVGRKMAKHVDAFSCKMRTGRSNRSLLARTVVVFSVGTTFPSARIQSHSGSIHSPHRIRKIIMNEWKKSLKFHLKTRTDGVV